MSWLTFLPALLLLVDQCQNEVTSTIDLCPGLRARSMLAQYSEIVDEMLPVSWILP